MDYAIDLKNITKDFPGVRALDDISFSVRKGEIHGFLGPNGAGKSTTMNIITGLIRPTSGTVNIFGESIKSNSKKNLNLGIGFLPENPPLYSNMNVENYLKFVAQIYGLEKEALKSNVDSVIVKCGLKTVRKRLIGNLSRGYKQRVAIAQALVYGPEIVILDEPTVGLDPSAIVEIRELILGLQKECTILLSTHQLHVANIICSEITIINDGKIVETGPKDEMWNRFKNMQIIEVSILNWQDSLKEQIMKSFQGEVAKVDNIGKSYQVRIHSKETADIRAPLSEFFVKNDCGLLSIKEERLDLEAIFTKATTTTEVNCEFC